MRIPKKLMPHTVTVTPFTGAGTYGDTWGTAFTIKRAYVEETQQVIVSELGEQEPSSGFVIIDPAWQIPAQSTITIWPGAPNERTARVMKISRYDHPSAASHQVVFIGGNV